MGFEIAHQKIKITILVYHFQPEDSVGWHLLMVEILSHLTAFFRCLHVFLGHVLWRRVAILFFQILANYLSYQSSVESKIFSKTVIQAQIKIPKTGQYLCSECLKSCCCQCRSRQYSQKPGEQFCSTYWLSSCVHLQVLLTPLSKTRIFWNLAHLQTLTYAHINLRFFISNWVSPLNLVEMNPTLNVCIWT